MNDKQIFYVISCVSGCAVLLLCEWVQGNHNTKWLDYIRFYPITDRLTEIVDDSELNSISTIMQEEFTLRDELQKALGEDWHVCTHESVLQALSTAWVDGTLTPDNF